MRKLNFFVRAATIVFTFFAVASCTNKGTSTSNDKITLEVDRICDSVIANTNLTGMVVGIWSEDKGFSYLKTKGYMSLSKDSMKAQNAFRIGSNTKTFVVTAILQLVDNHQLSLEDSLGKFLPGFKNGSIVTIRMLCNMTSGILSYTDTQEFIQQLEKNPMKSWTGRDLINLVKDSAYKFSPGSSFYYSNTNTAILGMIIEKLTGHSLAENLQQRFFTKMHLSKTYLPMDYHMAPNGIHGILLDTLTGTKTDVTEAFSPTWAWAAGGMISNVMDIKNWVTALVNGQLLSANLQAERFTPGTIPDNTGLIYGLGIVSFGKNMWGHTGGLPGYTSIMMHHKTKDITYVIFFNTYGMAYLPEKLFKRLLPVVNPEL